MIGMRGRSGIPRDDIVKLAALGPLAVGDEKLAAMFCEAVRAICYDESGGSGPACGEVGLIALVLECVRSHPDDASVQSQAFPACNNLLLESATNSEKFVALGGLDTLYTTWKRHTGIVNIAWSICGVTAKVVAVKSLRPAVLSSGGLNNVCDAMAAQPGHAYLQCDGCSALWSLALSADGKAAVLASSRAVSLLRAAKAQHTGDVDVKKYANGALSALGLPL